MELWMVDVLPHEGQQVPQPSANVLDAPFEFRKRVSQFIETPWAENSGQRCWVNAEG